MRWSGVIRILVAAATMLAIWYFAEKIFSVKLETRALQSLFGKDKAVASVLTKKRPKCGNEKDCPENYFAFKMISGAANVVGPSICFEDKIIMSGVKNNIGRGLNIALVNATTGEMLKTGHYDMYSGDIKEVKAFLAPVKDGTLIFVATYDDPATKMDAETRDLFTSYGSSVAKKLAFRDGWLFVGGKGLKNKSPFEQYIKNNKETNKYDGWPEVLEMDGCIPKKVNQ